MTDRVSVLLIALAALLWGTDALFRAPLLGHLSSDSLVGSTQLVFAEHAILTLLVLPFLWRSRRAMARLRRGQWAAIIAIGVGASALATILFTMSFGYGRYIETLLLQKMQPLFAVVLARLWLRERLPARSYLWIPLGIAGAYLITFPDPLLPLDAAVQPHIAAALLALGAAAIWGTATVLGRFALADVPFTTLTALRFTVALPALAVALSLMGGAAAFTAYRASDAPLYLGIALVPGLIPMLLYYRGLASTPASMATIAELAFPVSAVLVNVFLVTPPQTVTGWQIAGITVLSLAIVGLNVANARRPPVLAGASATASPA